MTKGDKPREDHEALSPELYAALLESGSGLGGEPAWLVVLAHRQEPPGEKRLKALAETFDIDPWTAAQWVRSPAPRVIRRVGTADKARKWIEYFEGLHLGAFTLAEETLPERAPRQVRSFALGSTGIVFDDGEGTTDLPAGEILCLVAGEIREDVMVDHTEKLGLMGELSRGSERTHARRRFVVDVHGKDPGMFFRLDQESLDYRALFPDREQASSVMIREILNNLVGAFPAAPLFIDFALAQDALGSAHQLLERSTGVVRRWLHGARGVRISESRTTLVTTFPAFQIYSVFLAEECRQLGVRWKNGGD